MRVRVL